MRPALLVASAALAAGPAAGQAVSAAPDRAAVVIYRGSGPGLAFISETRTVELPAGRSRIAFRGVADTMVPQTAAVEGLPGAQIERNEDYNLLSPGSLLAASVGKPVKLVRTNPVTGAVTVQPAIVRAGPDQPVLEVNGHLEGLGCSGAPERLVFEDLPANLSDKPTFSVLADAPRPGRYKVRLSYLATGFDWQANYVARLAPDGRSLDLTGWLTLKNDTSANFADAPTQVVAGELSRDRGTAPPRTEASRVDIHCWPVRPDRLPPLPVPPVARFAAAPLARDLALEEIVVTGQKIAVQSELGDYKLYTLPEPTTVAAHQAKQVLFLDQKRVPVERVYAYAFDLDGYGNEDSQVHAASVVLRLANTAAAGLGKPLPSGNVVVMEPAAGGPVFAGEHAIGDTPVGLPLELEIGQAMDVAVRARVVDDRSARGRHRADVEVTLANAKPQPITLEYRQARTGQGFKVLRASLKPGVKNGDPTWSLRLAPGERKTLTYRVTFRR
jgi:hypothetical protein